MALLIKSLAQIEPYKGKNTIPGMRFKPVRAALDVTAWGMNVLELDPGCDGYPEHDHVNVMKDGQEEVYLVLDGEVVLIAEGIERTMRRGDIVRVPAEVPRKFVTRATGATLLALGGTPGKAYAPR